MLLMLRWCLICVRLDRKLYPSILLLRYDYLLISISIALFTLLISFRSAFVLFLDGGHGKGPKGNPEGHEVELQPLNPAELKSADGDVEKPG